MSNKLDTYKEYFNISINPAYSAFLIAIFLKKHASTKTSINLPYLFLVLPFAINPQLRKTLIDGRKNNLLALIQENKDIYEQFDRNFHFFSPYTYEALYFLLKAEILIIHEENIMFNHKKVKLNQYSHHLNNEIKACKRLSTLLNDKFDTVTIYTSLGISL